MIKSFLILFILIIASACSSYEERIVKVTTCREEIHEHARCQVLK